MMSKKSRMNGLLTLAEVSQILNVDVNTLKQWTDKGVIRAQLSGKNGNIKFRAEDVAIFLLEDNAGFQMNLNILMNVKNKKNKKELVDVTSSRD
jgi:predicted site-specific integrase-resolvase